MKNTRSKVDQQKININGITVAIPSEFGSPFEKGKKTGGRKQEQIPNGIQELLTPLVNMATHAWRLKIRMVNADGEPKEETRKLFRYVEGIFRALDDAGIEVIDKTGKLYDSGMPEKVINFEETPGKQREEIIETIRPAVRWKKQFLFLGEIIVGIPVVGKTVEIERGGIAIESIVKEKEKSNGQSKRKTNRKSTKWPEQIRKKKTKKRK